MKYTTAIQIAKPAAEVFDHLIDLTKWWPEDFEGEALGLHAEFVFKTGDGHYSKNKVTEFVPGQKLVWLTTESLRKADNFDWTGTYMIFELTPKADKTLVTFTYDGVVLEQETERLVQICDLTLKELFYNFSQSFRTAITVAQPPGRVFQCLTRQVAKWWGGPDLSGDTARLNDEFVINHPGSHYSKQRLVEMIANKKLVWLVTESTLSWLEGDQREWQNTKISFEINAVDDQTILHFTHQGLVPEKECYELCSQGWTTVIQDYLFHLITQNKPHF